MLVSDINQRKIIRIRTFFSSARKFSLFIICIIILHHLSPSAAQVPDDFLLTSCPADSGGNYTSNSTYHSNLKTVLSSISSNTNVTYGFYNFSFGREPDRASVITLCRGDMLMEDCRSCVSDSTVRILQDCPNKMEGLGWYEKCMIRYSNKSILGVMESDLKLALYSTTNVANYSEFYKDLQKLLNSLKKQASSGNSTIKFAAADASGPDKITLYALSQCTPDISELDCNDCIDATASWILGCCNQRIGGRIVTPSCNLRYEVYPFYESVALDLAPTPPGPPPSQPPSPSLATAKRTNTTRTVVIVVVPWAIVTAAVLIFVCIFLRGRRSRKRLKPASELQGEESLRLDFAKVKMATTNFSDANKLGEGGFGTVYKGRLSDGRDIAVKRLSTNSGQGNAEFINEVVLVAQLQHRNLVRLLGFCLEGTERLLIYEFVTNASLDQFVFDPEKKGLLNWEKRYKIIGGVAKGLLYLHEDSRLRIIHRDLKAGNVLLDGDMNPKIADFGMAKLFVMDQTHYNTSRIVGTYGYMAPEYAMHGQFSVKSDVFSFGVLILEIIRGQSNNSFHAEDLVSYAWKNWREGSWSYIVDPKMRDGSSSEMMRCIHIALLCVQENPADRPTMATVGLMLNSHSLTLPVPLQPAFFLGRGYESDVSSPWGRDSRASVSRSEVLPLSVASSSDE